MARAFWTQQHGDNVTYELLNANPNQGPKGDPGEPLMDAQTVTGLPGFPTRDQMLARYGNSSGRDVSDMTFYFVLAVWKLAILLEGSFARHLAGVTDDAFFSYLGQSVPALARRAESLTGS